MENTTSSLCFDSITTAKYSKVQYSAVLIWKSHHRGCGRRYQHKFRISKEMNITTCNYILIVLVLNFTAFDFGWDEESVRLVLVSKESVVIDATSKRLGDIQGSATNHFRSWIDIQAALEVLSSKGFILHACRQTSRQVIDSLDSNHSCKR